MTKRNHNTLSRAKRIVCAVAATCTGLLATAALGAPSQDEVFSSIREHVGDSTGDAGAIGLLVLGGCVAMAVLVWLSRREVRVASTEVVNHPGKLLKEIVRETGLKPAELKHLKTLAESLEVRQNIRLKSPLTLMLCPSVLHRLIREQTTNAEKKQLLR
jgi:hypothetical protein